MGIGPCVTEFEVPGRPVTWKRPVRLLGRRAWVNNAEDAAHRAAIALCAGNAAIEARRRHIPDDAYIAATVHFVFAYPKSASRADRERMLRGIIRPRGDCDNLGKAVFDALNGIAYKDDDQVALKVLEKYYGEESRTIVRLNLLLPNA